MRFFSDNFFSDDEKQALMKSEYFKKENTAIRPGEQVNTGYSDGRIKSVARSIAHNDFVFLWGILGLYLAAALFAMVSHTNLLA